MEKSSHKVSGLHRILNIPLFYNFIQWIFSHKRTQDEFIDMLGPTRGKNILDVGCGTGDFFEIAPDSNYIGFDISAKYIKKAEEKYRNRAIFFCDSIDNIDFSKMPELDIVVLRGVFHHLSDKQIYDFLASVSSRLSPKGFILSIDNCYHEKQNYISRLFVSLDRGKNVKFMTEYKETSEKIFPYVTVKHINQVFRPYDRCLHKLSFNSGS